MGPDRNLLHWDTAKGKDRVANLEHIGIPKVKLLHWILDLGLLFLGPSLERIALGILVSMLDTEALEDGFFTALTSLFLTPTRGSVGDSGC